MSKFGYVASKVDVNDPFSRINILSECIFYHFSMVDAKAFDATCVVLMAWKTSTSNNRISTFKIHKKISPQQKDGKYLLGVLKVIARSR